MASHPTAFPRDEALDRLRQVQQLLAEPLARVEEEFRRGVGSEHPALSPYCEYIAASGGKRLRPLLLLLMARACGYRGAHDALFGAVLELIHTATLVHDDVIDGADTRRGRESANFRWGNTLTVLLGDFLYIRSMSLALESGLLQPIRILSDVTQGMIEGEMLQESVLGRIEVTEEQHLEIVQRKTAMLFAGACHIAAELSGVEPAVADKLRLYGNDLGMAFQLIDDHLDVVADHERMGKPVASDLREGKMTIPYIRLLARGDEDDRRTIASVLAGEPHAPQAVDRLTRRMDELGILDESLTMARGYARAASEHLDVLPPSTWREALKELPEFVVARDH